MRLYNSLLKPYGGKSSHTTLEQFLRSNIWNKNNNIRKTATGCGGGGGGTYIILMWMTLNGSRPSFRKKPDISSVCRWWKHLSRVVRSCRVCKRRWVDFLCWCDRVTLFYFFFFFFLNIYKPLVSASDPLRCLLDVLQSLWRTESRAG